MEDPVKAVRIAGPGSDAPGVETRRSFVSRGCVGVAGAALGAYGGSALEGHPAPGPPGPFANLSAEVGRRYLSQFPAEADVAVLEAELGRAAHDRRAARREIRADFRDGRTVEIDGWLLSRTEARLSALLRLRRA